MPKEKELAHGAIITEIDSCYYKRNDYSLAITALASVLMKMRIPSDKVSGIRKRLFNVFLSNPAEIIDTKNVEALRTCINNFEKEYPPND